MDDFLAQLVPGYREAVEQEQASRDAAFIDVTHSVCGVDVLPLTLRHLSILLLVRSPFVCGGMPTSEDVAKWLWIMSPDFSTDQRKRDKFVRSVRGINFVDVVVAIREFTNAQLRDVPTGSKGPSAAAITSSVATFVHVIATEYHWPEADIMRIPIQRLAQYLRLINRAGDPKAIFVNPSDHIVADYMRKKNAAKKEARN